MEENIHKGEKNVFKNLKELLQINNEGQTTQLQRSNTLGQTLSFQKGKYGAHKHRERCSASSSIREIQMQSISDTISHPVERIILKPPPITNTRKSAVTGLSGVGESVKFYS